MGAVKIKAVDRHFSNCVRERASWCCERCGKYYPEGPKRMGLHCSHFHGRGKWGTRIDPENCESLCYGCHIHMGSNPYIHMRRREAELGEVVFDLLRERSNDTRLGRMIKKQEREASKHYLAEYRRMQALRAEGVTGRIEFENFT